MNRLLLCGNALLLTACGPVHTVPSQEKPLAMVDINLEQNGSSIVLKKGDALRVTLPGDPKSGYLWEIAQVDDTLLSRSAHAVFTPSPDPDDMGAFLFTFPVRKAGMTPLRMVYRHAHDKDRKPLKVFILLVTIQDN